MLMKISEILGSKVLSLRDGKNIAQIKGVLYNPVQNKVVGLIVKQNFWTNTKMIAYQDLRSIGHDAVMVDSNFAVKPITFNKDFHKVINSKDNFFTSSKIFTDDGTELGRVNDVFFDPQSGKIEELELYEGLVQNANSEKRRIQISQIVTLGKEVVIVKPAQVREAIASQPISDTVSNFGEQIKEQFDHLTQRTKQMFENKVEEEKIGEEAPVYKEYNWEDTQVENNPRYQTFYHNIKDEFDDTKRRDAIGQFLTKSILTHDDKLLAKRGDMVTNRLLEKADEYEVTDQILAHLSTEPIW